MQVTQSSQSGVDEQTLSAVFSRERNAAKRKEEGASAPTDQSARVRKNARKIDQGRFKT